MTLRAKLNTFNEEFFLFLKQRKKLVQTIQLLKDKKKTYYCFDPAREFSLFTSMSNHLEALSLKELYVYSLILEDHAATTELSYPMWSEQIHLYEKNQYQFCGINPILLAVTYKDLYDQLPLNKKFKILLEKHVK